MKMVWSYSFALIAFIISQRVETAAPKATSTRLVRSRQNSTTLLQEHSDRIEPRIVGGSNARIGDYPWFVASSGKTLCGGSLVHQDVVLTAAHCHDAFQMGDPVFVGAYFHGTSAGNAYQRTITHTLTHPAFDANMLHYDFLLLKLNRAVPWIEPIALNRDTHFPTHNQVLTTMGFGQTTENGDVSSVLLHADVQAIDHDVCENHYAQVFALDGETPFYLDPQQQLCAGTTSGGVGACNGDSGGPLVSADGKLVGVVSASAFCGSMQYPGIYARVSGVYDWIQHGICDLSSDPPSTCGEPCDTKLTSGSVNVTRTARLRFYYDEWVNETSWTVSQGSNVIYSGPLHTPEPNQVWETTFEQIPMGNYVFAVSCSNGLLDGWFEIHEIIDDLEDVLLASGNHEFECAKSVNFTVR